MERDIDSIYPLYMLVCCVLLLLLYYMSSINNYGYIPTQKDSPDVGGAQPLTKRDNPPPPKRILLTREERSHPPEAPPEGLLTRGRRVCRRLRTADISTDETARSSSLLSSRARSISYRHAQLSDVLLLRIFLTSSGFSKVL